ncbi:fatty acid desaturase [Vulcanococcus sp.]|uniref:fatty acid desaturase n=1 Tax=Vulcanococcus sp. TaxID=2856995 RepID=UPI003F699E6C
MIRFAISLQHPKLKNRGDFSLAPFRRSSNALALWQLLSTLLPMALLWASLPWICGPWGPRSVLLVPVVALLVLFSARSFSLMHDCGHGSLFRSKPLNRLFGFLLGVVNAIPQHPWSRGHAFHHLHNGNWERYRGPSALLTLEQFQQLSPQQQQRYGWSRHPLMLFPGGFSYLVIRPRLQLLLGVGEWLQAMFAHIRQEGWRGLLSLKERTHHFQSSHWYTGREFIDLLANNLCVLASWWWMSHWLGMGLFWSVYALVMTCSAAIFICIFFVQHNFPGSYANATEGWSYFKGAMEGSSNLILPGILNWFSADIAFHSIHHLCERIPNYHLRACHQANQHLLGDCVYLRLHDLPRCFKLILWDSSQQELVALPQA